MINGISAKTASLVAGVLQQTCLVLIIRYSKIKHANNSSDAYITSVAVAASEIFKMCLSYVLEVKSETKLCSIM